MPLSLALYSWRLSAQMHPDIRTGIFLLFYDKSHAIMIKDICSANVGYKGRSKV